jgi:hypothetical protein
MFFASFLPAAGDHPHEGFYKQEWNLKKNRAWAALQSRSGYYGNRCMLKKIMKSSQYQDVTAICFY